ncbi:hypothetical protein [Streptomyces sp. NBC_01615]|uniref:hypothetical protein n=1 Tax=Streptomyces sp. NBC_01615 TaxID=2975898 RepID=UPI003868B8BC
MFRDSVSNSNESREAEGLLLKAWIFRAATIGAAIGLVVGVATSAQAADAALSIYKDGSRVGYIHHFDADPDSFSVCDTKADGYGVTGKLYAFINTDWFLLASEDDGGDAGCDGFIWDLGAGTQYMWTIERHGGGPSASGYLKE